MSPCPWVRSLHRETSLGSHPSSGTWDLGWRFCHPPSDTHNPPPNKTAQQEGKWREQRGVGC